MRSNKRLKVKNACAKMREHMEMYFELVWYARNANKPKLLDREAYETLAYVNDLENKYPDEIKKLREDDNWHHGFNSGMLAASRLYIEMIEGNPEFALECHPDLDS